MPNQKSGFTACRQESGGHSKTPRDRQVHSRGAVSGVCAYQKMVPQTAMGASGGPMETMDAAVLGGIDGLVPILRLG
jgi:hypothetical protein